MWVKYEINSVLHNIHFLFSTIIEKKDTNQKYTEKIYRKKMFYMHILFKYFFKNQSDMNKKILFPLVKHIRKGQK